MRQQITERDIALLQDVYTYRYLTTSQLRKLHFSSEKTAWRRLQILSELGFIKPFTAPAIPERIFYLNKKGAEIISVQLQVSLEDLSWNRLTRQPKDYYFLRHFLAINDFRILLTQAHHNHHTDKYPLLAVFSPAGDCSNFSHSASNTFFIE